MLHGTANTHAGSHACHTRCRLVCHKACLFHSDHRIVILLPQLMSLDLLCSVLSSPPTTTTHLVSNPAMHPFSFHTADGVYRINTHVSTNRCYAFLSMHVLPCTPHTGLRVSERTIRTWAQPASGLAVNSCLRFGRCWWKIVQQRIKHLAIE